MDSERLNSEAGVGRIPIRAMLDYARAFDFSYEQMSDLCRYIREMDGAYIKYIRDKTPKPPKGKSKGKGRR